MKSSLLVAMFVITGQLFSMDLEEQKPAPEHQRQLLVANQRIPSKKFAKIIKTYTSLEELDASGHAMQHIPAQNLTAQHLTILNLNNGPLAESDSLIQILTICPQLEKCFVAHNDLTTLDEFKIPSHKHLNVLDCSHNKIKNVNFTQLYKKLHKLCHLNLSNCPLTIFETDKVREEKFIPTIDLKNTQLDDIAKKSIIKNSSFLESTKACGPVVCCAFIGLTVGMLTPIIAFASSGFDTRAHSGVFDFTMAASSLTGVFVIGPACGYFGYLTCTAPKDRVVTVFTPQFDEEPAYTEEEVTTRFQRFVRYFPYAGNLFAWCKTKTTKQEYALLTDVEENE